ncbi:MAG TPA: hypothetical protein VF657_11630 [Actinoplanes sp.]
MHPFIAHELFKIRDADLRAEADRHRLAAKIRSPRRLPLLPALGGRRRTACGCAQPGAC